MCIFPADWGRTGYQRLMESEHIDQAVKTWLTEQVSNLNPFKLKKQIEHHQRLILRQLR